MSLGADMKADILAATDRGESVFLMEPLLIGETSRLRGKLTDMAVQLAQKAAGFVTREDQPDRDDEKMRIVSWQDGINQPSDREWSDESQQTCQGEANKTCNMQGELRFDLRE